MCAEPALPGWSCLGSSSTEEKPAEGREIPQEFTHTGQRRCNKPHFLPFLTLFAAQSVSVAAQLNHNTPDSLASAWDPPAPAPCGSNPSHSIPGTARGLWPMPGLGFPQDELSLMVFSSQDVILSVSLSLSTANHCSGVITVHS